MASTVAAVAAVAASPPPPSHAWIGGCLDSALLEDYLSGSDRDDYSTAPVEAPATAPLGGGVAALRTYASDGSATALPWAYSCELQLTSPEAGAEVAALVALGAPNWAPSAQAKMEPPAANGGAYGGASFGARLGWERDAFGAAVGMSAATAAARGGGGAPLPIAGTARPLALSPVAAMSPLAGGTFDPRTFFEPFELFPSTADPSDVTGTTPAVADPDGAHLHKRELADPPFGDGCPGGAAAAVDVEAASSSGTSYVEARMSPTTLTAVSRRLPAAAADRAAVAVHAARSDALPGLGDADGARRHEWGKPPPAAMYLEGGVGAVGYATAAAAPPPPPAGAPATAASAATRGASTPGSSGLGVASTRVSAAGNGGSHGGRGSGSSSGGAGGSNPRAPATATAKPKRFECEECGQRFTERSNRKKHIEAVHRKLRPHGCATCGAGFAAKVNLHKHIQSVHEKSRPFPCSTCHAAFGERNKRDKHVRTVHGGERPWVCPACGHAFGQRSDLVRHTKIVHEGVRPHACPQPGCDKSFGRRGSLVHHLLVIHKAPAV